jgi:hypothetical protein
MVINGQVAAEVQRELEDLIHGAETFKVLVSILNDELENIAIVALNGTAERLADLAAFMGTTEAASAR